MPLCLTISIIRCGSRVKWGNTGKGVVPSLSVVANEKGAFRTPSTTVNNFTISLKVFLSNTNNFQTDPFDLYAGS